FLVTTLPVVDLSIASSPAVFPHFADGGGWTTTISLVNPTSGAISGTLQFTDTAGAPASSIQYSIPGRSAQQYTTSGSGTSVRAGAVSIVPAASDPAPAGSLVFSYRKSSIRLTEAGVAAVVPNSAFHVYVEASDTIQSGIAIANPS